MQELAPLVEQLSGSVEVDGNSICACNEPFSRLLPQQALEILFTFLPDLDEPQAAYKPRIYAQNLRRMDKAITKLFAPDVDSIKTHMLGDLQED